MLLAAALHLYLTHIRGMQGGELQAQARSLLFHNEYIFGLADVPRTLLGATRYCVGGSHFALAGSLHLSTRFTILSFRMTAFTLAATGLMAFGLLRSLRGRALGTFLFPIGVLVTALGMSAAGQYPLGNSRHSVYLLVVFVPLLASGLADLIQGRGRLLSALGVGCLVVFSAVLNLQDFAGGLAANPPGVPPEQEIREEEVVAVRDLLLEGLGDDALLVTDWQTFQLLGVLLGSASSEVVGLEGTELVTLQAGGRRFLFGMPGMREPWRTWDLQWQRAELDGAAHLIQVLDALEADSAGGRYGVGRELWVLQGGWAPSMLSGRAARARSQGDFVTRVVGGEGFGAFRIDRAAYRTYLQGR